MTKYSVQVWLYTRYFSRMLRDNPGVLLYTICLPLFFLGLNTHANWGQPLSLSQFTSDVLPFIVWIGFANTLVAIGNVGALREDGYLKQYRTLVVAPSVFLVSQLFVNLELLVGLLGGMGVLCGLGFHLAVIPLTLRLWGMLFLTYLPTACFGLPLLALSLRRKTLDALLNVVLIVVMFGSLALSSLVSLNNPVVNLVSPIYLDLNVFTALATPHVSLAELGGYGLVVVILSGVGLWSLEHLKLLPAEAS